MLEPPKQVYFCCFTCVPDIFEADKAHSTDVCIEVWGLNHITRQNSASF